MKKNIYLAQINYLHGKSTFLPYAVGTLIACAEENKELSDYYCFKEPFFIREKIDSILERTDEPFLFGFSNYIWNHEFNKALAKEIKKTFPDCLILFGGHHISPDTSLMEEEDYIDLMCFGEGEETFSALLLALKNNIPLSRVPNIAFRENGKPVFSFSKKAERIDYPSPYLTGVFDSILEKYPQIDFHAVIETNRGCPYNCAYCDWGNLQCNIRFFPEEKVIKELNWLSDHNISGFGCADANFGMFERDEKFVDEMVRLHKEKGVLSRFQVSSAKNSNDRVFRISQKLNECGMDKGATLSFQSLSPTVLENIKRKNIPVETFTSLLNRYNEAGIATYSELILGLPGETFQSFVEGIDILLNAGQHSSIYIHDCEWLPCSAMGNKDYTLKHAIKFVLVPLNEPHTLIDNSEEIGEFSRLIVETKTMSREDWVKMNIYSATIQCFHHEGLLMLFALYLHHEKGLSYSEFYMAFIDYMFSQKNSVGGKVFEKLKNRFEEVTKGNAGIVWEDRRFGDVGWPSEEFAFLNVAIEKETFYEEIKAFLKQYFEDELLFENLFLFQKSVIKLPFIEKIDFDCEYDFKSYFSNLLCGNTAVLEKKSCRNTVLKPISCNSWKDYARFIVWYGRKDSRNIYIDEIDTQFKEV
ncbi:MAG: radical SAM protein [Clostridia bacterium]|nr:radical SAM protein [Clostridia bacterium]